MNMPMYALRISRNHNDDDKTEEHPVHPIAQALELQDRFRRASCKNHFAPGDLCRCRRGFIDVKSDPILMYWRTLHATDFQDQKIISEWLDKHYVLYVDCIVGMLTDDGSSVIFLPFCSALLEPHDPRSKDGEAA